MNLADLNQVMNEAQDANSVNFVDDVRLQLDDQKDGTHRVTMTAPVEINEVSIRLVMRALCRVKTGAGNIDSIEMSAPAQLISTDRLRLSDLYNPSIPLLINDKPERGNEATGEQQVFLDKLFIVALNGAQDHQMQPDFLVEVQ